MFGSHELLQIADKVINVSFEKGAVRIIQQTKNREQGFKLQDVCMLALARGRF